MLGEFIWVFSGIFNDLFKNDARNFQKTLTHALYGIFNCIGTALYKFQECRQIAIKIGYFSWRWRCHWRSPILVDDYLLSRNALRALRLHGAHTARQRRNLPSKKTLYNILANVTHNQQHSHFDICVCLYAAFHSSSSRYGRSTAIPLRYRQNAKWRRFYCVHGASRELHVHIPRVYTLYYYHLRTKLPIIEHLTWEDILLYAIWLKSNVKST